MNFNKALVNYIFKEGLKNDQSSVEVKTLLKELDEKLNDEEVYASRKREDLSLQEYKLESQLQHTEYLLSLIESRLGVLDSKVRERLITLKLRLLESKDLVRQALLSERSLTGESYTIQIPLTEEYISENTTATLEDGIVFGIGFNEKNVKNKVNLSALNISSEEDTKVVISTQKDSLIFNFEENLYKPYNQVKINVSGLTQTGILYMELEKPQVISILDENGYEIVEPYTTRKISLNIDNSSRLIRIRFANNLKRTVVLKEVYFTEAIYNSKTVLETKPIAIDKDLSYLTVQTCDNYSTRDISLNYEISINNSSYRVFRPNGKLNAEKIQSLIRTRDVDPTEVKLVYTDKEGGFYRYYNEDLVSQLSKIRAFSSKMGEDFFSLENHLPTTEEYSIFFYTEKDFSLKLSPSMYVFLDNVLITYEELGEGFLEIKKGLHSLKTKTTFWRETIDLDKYELVSVDSKKILYIERSDSQKIVKEVENLFDTSSFTTNSIYFQLFNSGCKIYLKEDNIRRKFDKNYIEYIYKEDSKPIYVYAEAYQTRVDTIQLRVSLESKDATICPYISRIIVRGV